MNNKIACSLLENAHDFIESAVEYAKKADSKEWKYAILHIVAGLELMLKTKLALEHWTLLFMNVDTASIDKLNSGDFDGVNFNTSIKRLESIVNISLSESMKNELRYIRNIRNKITHFHIELNEYHLKALVATGINAFIEFYNNYLLETHIADDKFTFELSKSLSKFKKFVEIRNNSLKAKLEISDRPRTHYFDECYDCLQDAAILHNNRIKCLFCGNEIDFKDKAESYSRNGVVKLCPECRKESFILHSSENEDDAWECMYCGFFKGRPIRWSDNDGTIISHLRY